MGVNCTQKPPHLCRFLKASSFVFIYLTGSLVLFLYFPKSGFPLRGHPRAAFPSLLNNPALSNDKSSAMTIIIGYHSGRGLSREKCQARFPRRQAELHFCPGKVVGKPPGGGGAERHYSGVSHRVREVRCLLPSWPVLPRVPDHGAEVLRLGCGRHLTAGAHNVKSSAGSVATP